MKTLTDIEKGIVESFDRKYPSYCDIGQYGDEIKSFLKSALVQQREKTVEEMEKLSEFRYPDRQSKDVILWMHVRKLINKLENHGTR